MPVTGNPTTSHILVALCTGLGLDYEQPKDQYLNNTSSWNDFFAGNATILTEFTVALATVAWLYILRQRPKDKE